jgi:hypothetical protein
MDVILINRAMVYGTEVTVFYSEKHYTLIVTGYIYIYIYIYMYIYTHTHTHTRVIC